MKDRLKEAVSTRQPGQVLVIFAIAAPILIAMLGFGIDISHVYQEKRDLQNAVDLAALGGVSQMPGNAGAAQSIAVTIANSNGETGDAFSAVAGVNGDNTRLQVSGSRDVDMFFMSVLGYQNVTISARAVAEHAEGKGTAIFAKKDTHCWVQSIYVPNNNITIDGDAHSNSGMTWSGSNNTLNGKLDHGAGCESNVRMTGTNPNVPAPQPVAHREWPVIHNPSSFTCTFTVSEPNLTNSANASIWVGNSIAGKKLKPGTICYTGNSTMTLAADGVSGNVTFKAKYINLSGSNYNLTPYKNGVLVHSTGLNFPSVTMNVGGRMEGMLVNQNMTNGSTQGGQIDITGRSGFVLDGSIVTWSVVLRGSGWTITSTLDGTPEPMRLVE